MDYVIDASNPTGYAQVLEEWTSGGTPALQKSYTIGQSILSQWTDQTSQVLFLLADGHGSTQMLVDAAGAIQQSYDYDAYGNLINPPANPLTSHLYTGEQFDARTGQYYLRARYYDSATCRFSRLDPYAGSSQDPLTLHKYAYCQASPATCSDPTGLMMSEFSLAGMMANVTARVLFFAVSYGPQIATVTFWSGVVFLATCIAAQLQAEGFIPDNDIVPVIQCLSGFVFSAGMGLGILSASLGAQARLTVRPLSPGNGQIMNGETANVRTVMSNPGYANSVPYDGHSLAAEGRMASNVDTVRVHMGDNIERSWVLLRSDLQGLTPQQIADKWALPYAPTEYAPVRADGILSRVGFAARNVGYEGGGLQIELLERGAVFGQSRPLPPGGF